MEELLAGFQGAFSVAVNPYDTSRPHPRLTQYKSKRVGYGDQEARRKKALEEQCLRRKDFCDYSRRIVEGDLISDDEMEEEGTQAHTHTLYNTYTSCKLTNLNSLVLF